MFSGLNGEDCCVEIGGDDVCCDNWCSDDKFCRIVFLKEFVVIC